MTTLSDKRSYRKFLWCLVLAPLLMAAQAVDVSTRGGGKYAAVSVTTTATKMTAGAVSRKTLALYNNGASTEYCGFDSSVSIATGFPVAAGSPFTADFGDQAQVFCIVASGSNDNRVLEAM